MRWSSGFAKEPSVSPMSLRSGRSRAPPPMMGRLLKVPFRLRGHVEIDGTCVQALSLAQANALRCQSQLDHEAKPSDL